MGTSRAHVDNYSLLLSFFLQKLFIGKMKYHIVKRVSFFFLSKLLFVFRVITIFDDRKVLGILARSTVREAKKGNG
jgi:hypothetical protein